MGYLTKSKRFENNEFTINIGDGDFTFSLGELENNINLNERESMLFQRAAEINSNITLDKNTLKSGSYTVNLIKKTKEEKEQWLNALNELLNQKLIKKIDDKTYEVTKKGKEYYSTHLQ